MVNFNVVRLIILTTLTLVSIEVRANYFERFLGEKRLDGYAQRYYPAVEINEYNGRIHFRDDLFFSNYFQSFIFDQEDWFTNFFKSELATAVSCNNEQYEEHFEEIRYSYRLIALSYLLESQWHMDLLARSFNLKNACSFDLESWISTCRPKSPSMQSYISKLKKFNPKYDESMPSGYQLSQWMKDLENKKYQWISHYKMKKACSTKNCTNEFALIQRNICLKDQTLMSLICSEEDSIYGLSAYRDAYYLLGISNIINTFNKNGEALACLRRFTESNSPREVRYDSFENTFSVIQSFLSQKYQERYLQGRTFFYGSGKEFEKKGLQKIYVADQPFKIESIITLKEDEKPLIENKALLKTPEIKIAADAKKTETKKNEMPSFQKMKSAFLQAAEAREIQSLDRVEVDMLKLKYDFVFSLNMINILSEKLKLFMERDSLFEMQTYDKLGTSEGPVPLLFLKFMMDMQEHQGLWNIVLVLGDKFYVSNEIDSIHKPKIQYIQLINNESTGRQWQIYILKP